MTLLLLVLGVVALYFGAEWLVRGASRIAGALEVSTLVIGLTVVAFGTSTPEMVAGAVAAWRGSTDVVLGNVIGSNIANIGLILGLSAAFVAIPVHLKLISREIPLMVGATVVVWGLAATGELGRFPAMLLFLALIASTWTTLRWARMDREAIAEEEIERLQHELGLDSEIRVGVEVMRVVGGLVLLTVGAHWLVTAAIDLARTLGVSEFLISVTMVAVGTSLPELATSVIAAMRNEADVLVGNIVGSNLFNLLGAVGVAGMIRPIPVDRSIVLFDLPVVLAFSVAMALMCRSARQTHRWEGVALLAGYALYVLLLFR
jgi:cation:H+ antiporter